MRRVFVVVFLCAVILQMNALKKYTRTAFVMGTVLTVNFFANRDDGEKILDGVFEMASGYEAVFSSRREDGLVYQLNSTEGGLITNQDLLTLLREALYYYRITDGAFDPGLYRLISLWHVEDAHEKPADDAIRYERTRSGADKIMLAGDLVSLKDDIGIDLGAIAKGYIIGKLGEYLSSAGVGDFMINGGGDLVLKGKFNGKRPWNIAVADPYKPNTTMGYMILTDTSIVTSGDYERYFIGKDGKRYHHILDPATGYPADSGVNSVTVIAKDAARADALSTALFVMGAEKGLAYAEQLSSVDVIFISKAKGGQMEIKTTSRIGYRDSDYGYEFYYK